MSSNTYHPCSVTQRSAHPPNTPCYLGVAPPSAAALGLLALFGMPSVVRGSAGVAGMPCAAAPVRLSPLAREFVAAAHTGQGLTPASAPPNSVWEAAECYFAEWSK
jgi:hypothetical protein